MGRALKWVLLTVALLLVVIVGTLLFVLFGLDPNAYKDDLQTLAARQGVSLNIEGDLSWKLFPQLAIQVGKTSLSSTEKGLPDTRFETASLSVDLWALLDRRVAVKTVSVDGADITLTRAEQGAAIAAAPATGNSPVAVEDSSFSLAVEKLSLTNSKVTVPGDEAPMELSNLFVESKSVNVEGELFPVSARFDLSGGGFPANTHIELDSALGVSPNGQQITLGDTTLSLALPEAEPLRLNFSGALNLAEDSLRIDALKGTLGDAEIAGDAQVQGLTGEPNATGNLSIARVNPRQMLKDWLQVSVETTDPKALTSISLSTRFIGSASAVNLEDLKLNLDDTTFTGAIRAGLAAPRNLKMTLRGDNLNLDRYLAPESEEESTEPGGGEALLAPLAAPLAWLEGGKGDIDLQLQQLQVQNIAMDNIRVTLAASGKKLAIKQFSTGVFGGNVSANADIDMGGNTPSLRFAKQITGLQIEPAMAILAEDVDVAGKLTMDIQGTSRGASAESLMSNLKAAGKFQVEEPYLKTMNLEKSYCELAALVEKTPARTEPWPAGTHFNTMAGNYTINGDLVTLEQVQTGVGNLKFNADGKINTQKDSFNFLAISNLQGDRTSETGCIVKSKRIRNRDIPLRCKDTFANAGPRSCKPDGDIVKQLAQEEVLERIKEKSGLDEPAQEAIDSILRGVFGGKKK